VTPVIYRHAQPAGPVLGVETFIVPPVRHTDEVVRQVETALIETGRLRQGDKVVIVAGSPPGTPGQTNALRVHRIGDAIAAAMT
jgi:pyruvate kinase